MKNYRDGKGECLSFNDRPTAIYSFLMKVIQITTVLIVTLSTCIYASGRAQPVTLDVKKGTLKQVFNEIKEQGDYYFLYNERLIEGRSVVNFIVVNENIEKVMEKLLANSTLDFSIRGKNVTVFERKDTRNNVHNDRNLATKQQTAIAGRVTDANNTPLAGVSVSLQGTRAGTVTDENGDFSILNNSGAKIIVFSMLGYVTKQLEIGTGRLNVVLEEESTTLDDVVVVGYTSVKKSALTSSVVTLQSEEITGNVTPDLGAMLQGKVAGLAVTNNTGQPGTPANIIVRGVGTITAGQSPLYVVDGIPGGSYNPNDVETITVLKDVGSTALYGADGANGVVVITTKHGRRNQAPVFTVRANSAITQPIWGRFKVADSKELYEFYESLEIPNFEAEYPRSLLDRDFDWLNETYHNGHAQEIYATATGGTERTTYMVSLNHYNQAGSLDHTFFKRTNARLNFTTQLASTLDLSVRMNMSENSRGEEWGHPVPEMAYRGFPWDLPFDENGVPIDIANTPVSEMEWHYANRQNPFHGQLYNYDKSGGVEMGLDFVVNWNILSWLTATNTTRLGRETGWSKQHYDARDNSQVHAGATLGNRNVEEVGYPLPSYRNTTLLKANHTISSHTLGAVLGYEISESKGTYQIGVSANGQPSGMDVISTGTVSSMRITDGFATPSASWSAFGQLSYSYADKYLVNATFRADASTRFAPDNRVGYFPAVSAGWVASDEDFLKDNPVLTYLKVRGSYGLTGNSSIGDFLFLDTYRFGSTYLGVPGAQPSRLANPELGWESATMLSSGIDFTLFNRVEASIDLYKNVNKDLLFAAPVPPSTGFYSYTRNLGSVSNRGLEFQVTSTNIRTSDWRWETSFNMSFNRNRIESLPGEDPDNPRKGAPIMVGSADSHRQRMEEGHELYSWYVKTWKGVNPDDGAPLWWGYLRDSEGNLTENEGLTSIYDDAMPMWHGTASPKFTGGFINTVSWKGLSLGVNIYFVYGGILNSNGFQSDASGLQYNIASMDNGLGWTRWKQPGDIADFPKAIRNNPSQSGLPSSRTLVSGSFLRVRNISLGYALPANLLSAVRLKSARITLTGDNLFTITKFPGADPETHLSSSGINSVAGVVGMRYPLYRAFALGLDISF